MPVLSLSKRRFNVDLSVDPRGTLFDRRDLLKGTQIGAWDEDGGTAVNNTAARTLTVAAAPKLVRWQMWRTPCDLRGTSCQTTNAFDTAFNGIRNALGAVPLIGLPPIWTDQYPTGPEPWSYAWQQWVVQRADFLLDGGGVQDVLFEMGNEPNLPTYGNLTAQQYFDQQWSNVPLLKKWARTTLGREIYVGGPGWSNTYEPNDLTSMQTFLTACKDAYTANGNDRDWIPDFVSTHCYLTSSENTSQANAQSRINDWGAFYRNLGTWIKTNFAGLTDRGYPLADQIKVVCSEFNDTIVNESTINDSQTWTDFYADAMMNMFKAAKVWAAVQFTINSHTGTALDLLSSTQTAKPLYNSFKTQWAKPVTSGMAFNTAEGGTNTTAVTTTNSAGASGVPFTSVNIGTGATFAYSTTRSANGTKSFQIGSGSTATFFYAQHSFPTLDKVWVRSYFYFTTNPPAFTPIRFIGANGTQLRGAIGIDATGHLTAINSAGSTIATAATAIALNQWIRVEALCTGSATAGQIEIKLFNTANSQGTTEIVTTAATINTGGSLTDIWWGESGAVANCGPYWMDDIVVDAGAYPGPSAASSTSAPVTVMRGIAVSGAEFGIDEFPATSSGASVANFSNAKPGTYDNDWHYDGLASLQYLYSQGHRFIRLPVRPERIANVVTTTTATLWTAEIDRLRDPAGYVAGRTTGMLDRIATAGMKAIIDFHSYGYYYTAPNNTTVGTRRAVGGATVTSATFADIWAKLAVAVGNHPAITGGGAYQLMNEPTSATGGGESLTLAMWKDASQAAITAIRAAETANGLEHALILVGGLNFSDLWDWQAINGSPWITDPADNFRYDAHWYWGGYADTANHSNPTYGRYSNEVANATAQGYATGTIDAYHTRLIGTSLSPRSEIEQWRDWFAANGMDIAKYGIISEFNWNNNHDTVAANATGSLVTGTYTGDQAAFNTLGGRVLTRLDELKIPFLAWSCGEWYGNPPGDPLSIYSATGATLNTKMPQATTWEAHPTFTG